jgi:hypothetical protein
MKKQTKKWLWDYVTASGVTPIGLPNSQQRLSAVAAACENPVRVQLSKTSAARRVLTVRQLKDHELSVVKQMKNGHWCLLDSYCDTVAVTKNAKLILADEFEVMVQQQVNKNNISKMDKLLASKLAKAEQQLFSKLAKYAAKQGMVFNDKNDKLGVMLIRREPTVIPAKDTVNKSLSFVAYEIISMAIPVTKVVK